MPVCLIKVNNVPQRGFFVLSAQIGQFNQYQAQEGFSFQKTVDIVEFSYPSVALSFAIHRQIVLLKKTMLYCCAGDMAYLRFNSIYKSYK